MMTAHRFGIMNRTPQFSENYYRFDTDVCDSLIEVEAQLLNVLIPEMCKIDFYSQTVGVICKGLNFSGVTLMPPVSVCAFLEITRRREELKELHSLMSKAYMENKYVIHFGV